MKANKRNGFGGVWPVVQRELREGARRPLNHWLRVGSAFGGIIVFGVIANVQGIPSLVIGSRLFACVHTLLLLFICCLIPAMTADCIARERRDGTLGFLFLTPLTSSGIVAGKAVVQLLRTFTVWLAVLPVLVVPVLTGGVSGTDAITAVMIEFCATILCLAAGLLASSLVKGASAAFILALVFAVVLVAIFSNLVVRALPIQWGLGQEPVILPLMTGVVFDFSEGFFPDIGLTVWNQMASTPAFPLAMWLTVLGESVLAALLVFFVSIKYAAHRIEVSWQDKSLSVRQEKLERQYCKPVFQRWFARRTQRAMDLNPIAWLQQYSWKARLGKWGACLVCVLVQCFITVSFRQLDEWENQQEMLIAFLIVIFTFVGVTSFLTQKQGGGLELILSTPLSVNRIICGRILGLWELCWPSAVVCCGSYFFIVAIGHPEEDYGLLGLALGCFFSLPFLTTYFSLSVKNVIVPVILTWTTLFLAYFTADKLMEFLVPELPWGGYSSWRIFGCVFGCYGFLAMLAYLRLRRNLSRRIYSF